MDVFNYIILEKAPKKSCAMIVHVKSTEYPYICKNIKLSQIHSTRMQKKKRKRFQGPIKTI